MIHTALTQVLRIGGQGEQGLGGGLEQEIINHRLVGPGQIADRGRQREHHMEVGHGQQLGFALSKPVPGRRPLAFRAVPVAAGIVGNLRTGTALAALHMPAERGRAAGLDRAHHLELAEADVTRMGSTPGGSVGAEDLRHLESRVGHGPGLRRADPREADDRAGSSRCG
ncbi:hypothetical protein BB934_40110 (plasmid) [Microvirga ossetica]|uniref:Uncharacterized protein n=1 Tax=Microvirga ossetica TaxID=1882682 RepID=A0A1B2EWR6_9HYPH|nr:hypothetical protein BB934_40110 [Microvirga ossetica]